MKRLERKLLFQCVLVGAALTVLVVAADAARLLVPPENWLYDRRARWCQFFSPPPTTSLVHLDIDDRALEVIGRWPWPRSTWATLLDEISLAGPKAVEFDVLLDRPSDNPADDAAMADAVARAGNVILPIQLELRQRESALYQAMFDSLRADPELGEDELRERMRRRGLARANVPWDQLFVQARSRAVYDRIRAELARSVPVTAPTATGPATAAVSGAAAPSTAASGPSSATAADPKQMLRDRILSRQRDLASPLSRLIDQEYDRLRAHEEAERFAVAPPATSPGSSPPPLTPTLIRLPPLRSLSESASGVAFVDYERLDDPVVRTVPMLFECDGKVFPQMGLALACRMLDVELSAIRVGDGELILPRGGRDADVRIPVAPPEESSHGVKLHTLFDIPWFGTRDWWLMYDHPAHATTAQHHSLLQAWTTRLTCDKIRRNNLSADAAVGAVVRTLGDATALARFEKYDKTRPPPDDWQARTAIVAETLAAAADLRREYSGLTPAELAQDPLGPDFLAADRALRQWQTETPALGRQLDDQRAELSAALKGKAALIGWIATAAVADFVPTSLHDKCPGVIVHGAVYNGIMTGEMWRRAPRAVTVVLTVALGLAAAFITGYFPPVPAVLSALALFAGYLVVNGIVLFDYGNRVVGAAAPLVAVGLVWSGCTATRVVAERAERERIRKRFSNYVDPKLVNYVLDNPTANFNGEKREMTVVFTDLVGFTTLSEKMGEKVVPLLNSLLEELVPVIRDVHRGYINKFLGDGIMFFFNAPYLTPTHAGDAVATVLAMHDTLADFNRRLVENGLPALGMRAGISTAEMIVGNAGGAGANDYTVLGDAVNLGARLEAANKLTGTRTLMTARTAEMLDGKILCRPIGRLKVVGKDEAVMVYEPLVAADHASEKDRDLAALTTIAVDAFVTARFADTLATLDRIDGLAGGTPSKLTTLYRRMCEQYLAEPPGEDFDGRVVLTEK